jgi:hypothetical protein
VFVTTCGQKYEARQFDGQDDIHKITNISTKLILTNVILLSRGAGTSPVLWPRAAPQTVHRMLRRLLTSAANNLIRRRNYATGDTAVMLNFTSEPERDLR